MGNAAKAIEAIHFAGSDLTTNYKVINELGLDRPCFEIRIENNSSEPILISYDGVTDHDFLDSGREVDVLAQTNPVARSDISRFKKGTKVYVKTFVGAKIPITGTIYLIGYF